MNTKVQALADCHTDRRIVRTAQEHSIKEEKSSHSTKESGHLPWFLHLKGMTYFRQLYQRGTKQKTKEEH